MTPGPTQSHKSRSHYFHLVLLFSICIYIATGWHLFCICFPCIVGSVVGEASVVLDIRLEVPAATPLITRIQGYKKNKNREHINTKIHNLSNGFLAVRGVFVLKSGLRILIWAPQVPFLVPPKRPFWVFLAILGVPKMALGVPESKF